MPQQDFTTPGADTFTVPAGVTSLTSIQVHGGGQAGNGATAGSQVTGGSGGHGGDYVIITNYSVTPSQVINLYVGDADGDSWFVDSSTYKASSGTNSGNSIGPSIVAGLAGEGAQNESDCNEDPEIESWVFIDGGDGGESGGGSSGGAGGTSSGNGSAGSIPGGGGGGGAGGCELGSNTTGGAGARGQVTINWTAPQTYDEEGDGGVVVDGTTIHRMRFNPVISSAGVVADKTCGPQVICGNVNASGGLLCNSSALVSVLFAKVASGGVVVSGSAGGTPQVYDETASGGFVCDGTSICTRQFSEVASGGILAAVSPFTGTFFDGLKCFCTTHLSDISGNGCNFGELGIVNPTTGVNATSGTRLDKDADLGGFKGESITFSHATALARSSINDSFSFHAWFYPVTLSNEREIATRGWDKDNIQIAQTNQQWRLWYDGSTGQIKFSVKYGSSTRTVTGPVLTAAVWQGLGCFHDATNDVIGIVVNGTSYTTAHADGVNVGIPGEVVYVGGSSDHADGADEISFDCIVDEIGYWSKAFSAAEIAQLGTVLTYDDFSWLRVKYRPIISGGGLLGTLGQLGAYEVLGFGGIVCDGSALEHVEPNHFGGIVCAGSAEVLCVHNGESSGGVIVAGRASFTDNITASGGVVVAGTGPIVGRQSETARGGLVASGGYDLAGSLWHSVNSFTIDVSLAADGFVALANFVDLTIDISLSPSTSVILAPRVSGGLKAGGSATVSGTTNLRASGGVVVDGAAVRGYASSVAFSVDVTLSPATKVRLRPVARGGVVLGTQALTSKATRPTVSGGLKAGGSAKLNWRTNARPSGGVVIGTTFPEHKTSTNNASFSIAITLAPTTKVAWLNKGIAGAVASGQASVAVITRRNVSGGVVLAGSAQRKIYASNIGAGGVVADGTPRVQAITSRTAAGGIVAAGAGNQKIIRNLVSTGGLVLGTSGQVSSRYFKQTSGGVKAGSQASLAGSVWQSSASFTVDVSLRADWWQSLIEGLAFKLQEEDIICYLESTPQRPTFPCVVLNLSSNDHEQNFSGASGISRASVQLDVLAKSESEKIEIADQIVELMSGYSGSLGNVDCLQASHTNSVDNDTYSETGSNVLLWVRVIELEISYAESRPILVFDRIETTDSIELALLNYLNGFTNAWVGQFGSGQGILLEIDGDKSGVNFGGDNGLRFPTFALTLKADKPSQLMHLAEKTRTRLQGLRGQMENANVLWCALDNETTSYSRRQEGSDRDNYFMQQKYRMAY